MRERSVNVVLVVEAEASHVDGVGVEVVEAEDAVGSLLGLAISTSTNQ